MLVDGQDLARLNGQALRKARLALAMVFQRANLVRRRSVLANVASGTLGRRRTLWTALGGLPAEELPMAQRAAARGRRRAPRRASAPTRCRAARRSARRSRGRSRSARSSSSPTSRWRASIRKRPRRSCAYCGGSRSRAAWRCCAYCTSRSSRLRYSHRVVGLRDGVVAFDLPADRCADQRDRAALQGSGRMSVDGTTSMIAPT